MMKFLIQCIILSMQEKQWETCQQYQSKEEGVMKKHDRNKEFGDLCEMAGRFSDDEEELKIPNMFFSEESILNKAKYVKQLLE